MNPDKAVAAIDLNQPDLVYPDCSPGLGSIIRSPNDALLIEGVRIEPATFHPDDRGFFAEIVRIGHGLAKDFPPATTQISAALSYPGTIKAFHYHRHQTDLWVPTQGMLQVALVDLRKNAPTFGVRNTFYAGELRPWKVLIPPGVGHGYKVIGVNPAMLVYVTDRFYNPDDEGRIPYNHSAIAYDWATQHK